jgi:hypothetical protein
MTWKFIFTYRELCKIGPAHNRCWKWSLSHLSTLECVSPLARETPCTIALTTNSYIYTFLAILASHQGALQVVKKKWQSSTLVSCLKNGQNSSTIFKFYITLYYISKIFCSYSILYIYIYIYIYILHLTEFSVVLHISHQCTRPPFCTTCSVRWRRVSNARNMHMEELVVNVIVL